MKKLGIKAGMTHQFNISSRRRLQDTVCVKFYASYHTWEICHNVETWIKNDPVTLYEFVHSGGCALNPDVHHKLKEAVYRISPWIIEEANRRRHELFTTRGKGKLKRER